MPSSFVQDQTTYERNRARPSSIQSSQVDSPDLVHFFWPTPPPYLPPRPPPSPTGSVQELIDTAPGDVECPSCSEPLTVDLSGGSPGADDEDEQEATGAAETGGRGRGRGGKGTAAARGRSRSGGRGGGRGGGSGGEVKGRMAGAVAALEASVRKAKVVAKKSGKPEGGGSKRSVTTHSVINRIDLNKFQSVSQLVLFLLCLLLFCFCGCFVRV